MAARNAAGYILSRGIDGAQTAVVLGSGLGDFSKEIEKTHEIAYSEIPRFPLSKVKGHAGRLIFGKICGKEILCLSGRCHYYEGYSMEQIAFYVEVLKLLGVKNLIITNAAGAINDSFSPGDFMLITDHIKLCADSPLRGEDFSGDKFVDMSNCYSSQLQSVAKTAAGHLETDIKSGVYAYMAGPQYETPAEIKMLKIIGADAVGMSTVPEAIAAAHLNMNVLGISCITNMAAGIAKTKLSHEEVAKAAAESSKTFINLLKYIIMEI